MDFRKTVVATLLGAGLGLGAFPAVAGHIPGISFGGTPFTINPMAVGETFDAFSAGALTFSYTAEVDQAGIALPPGVPPGPILPVPGATSAFAETGVADIGSFLNRLGGESLPAGVTGLNLGPGAVGYSLFVEFNGTGTATVNTEGGVNGAFTTFNLSFLVDRDNDSSISCPPPGGPSATTTVPAGGSCELADAGGADDDILVLQAMLLLGQGGFHVDPGIVEGDFDVKFVVTENTVGFFTFDTVPEGTLGEVAGENFRITGVVPPPFGFVDAIIEGSGTGVFQAVPEPGSLVLVGIGLLGFGFASRCRKLL